MRLLSILEEAFPKVWYHGSPTRFEAFDYQFAYTEKSLAQYGPGFYLASTIDEALGYAGAEGFIMEVTLKRRTGLKSFKARPYLNVARYIARMPDLEDTLANWDENPERAKYKLADAIRDHSPNLLEQVQMIWSECYRYSEAEFVARLPVSGLDGIVMPQQHGVDFLIAYNAEILRITKITPRSEIP